MYYALFAVLAIVDIVMDIVCKLFLNWVVVIFADKAGNLPRFLYWFQTFDATLYQGQLARERDLQYGKTKYPEFIPYPMTGWQRYLNRGLWLFRNTGYGFNYFLFGLKWEPETWKVLRLVNTPEKSVFFAVGRRGFNFYHRSKYGRYNLGWKARNMYDEKTGTFSRVWGDGSKVPLICSINPFRKMN